MGIERLTSLATEAISTVLAFHANTHTYENSPLPASHKHTIEATIRQTFPLRQGAQDAAVADLEIACDASVAVAQAINDEKPENEVNPRWVYHCVQSLLSVRLKPELMLDGEVDRLRPLLREEDSESHVVDAVNMAVSRSVVSGGEHEAELPAVEHVVDIKKEARAPWTDEEVRLMIELKGAGLTHEQVAAHIGRGRGSVENKYGRVLREDAWKGVILTPSGSHVRKRTRDDDGDQYNNDDDDDDEDSSPPLSGSSAPKRPARLYQPRT